MAITTYSELVTAIGNWVVPAPAAARIPEFIALAEATLNRTLLCRQMDEIATITITDGVGAVPTGFRQVRSFSLTATPYTRLSPMPADEIDSLDPVSGGTPVYYDRSGSNFIFWPRSDSEARLRYRKALTPLSVSAPTNWLLTEHPDIYLFSTLLHADLYDVDQERLSNWTAGLETAISQLLDQEKRMSVQTMRVQPSGGVV